MVIIKVLKIINFRKGLATNSSSTHSIIYKNKEDLKNIKTMTQEEKELLIKDLSARLPYKVKVSYYGTDEEMECTDIIEGIIIENNNAEIIIGQYGLSVEKVKPYLFPLSSMNSVQKLQYNFIVNWIYPNNKNLPEGAVVHTNKVSALLHFYNVYHLDYNGLISQGLALDATNLEIY